MAWYNAAALNRAANAYGNAITPYQNINPNVNVNLANDAYQNIDPTGKNAQEQAMGELQQEYAQGGLDQGARAAIQEAQLAGDQATASNEAGILASAGAKGELNSGRALGAQLQGLQQQQQSDAMAGAQGASDAANRAQQGLETSATIGSNLTGQGLQTAQGENQAEQFNVGAQNTQAQQNIANQFAQAGGIAQGYTNLGNFNAGNAAQANQMADAGINAVGNIAAAATKASDERLKEEIKPTGKHIDGVPEKTFKYKDDPTGQKFKGVVAQDVEKVRPEDVVKDEKGIRHVTKEKDKPKPLSFGHHLLGAH